MLVERGQHTAVWCSERSAADLDDYFDDDDGGRISRFARDLGIRAFQRDWVERIESALHGHGTVGALIRRTGGGDEMEASLGDLALQPARLVVVLYHVDVVDFPKELDGAPHPLRHLGNIQTPRVVRR